ncbi:hypothetical protein ACQB60_21830 [Actinomycetota bacterium Odt1-20B]
MPAADFTAARRARLSARFPGERLIVPAGELRVRTGSSGPAAAPTWPRPGA